MALSVAYGEAETLGYISRYTLWWTASFVKTPINVGSMLNFITYNAEVKRFAPSGTNFDENRN